MKEAGGYKLFLNSNNETGYKGFVQTIERQSRSEVLGQ